MRDRLDGRVMRFLVGSRRRARFLVALGLAMTLAMPASLLLDVHGYTDMASDIIWLTGAGIFAWCVLPAFGVRAAGRVLLAVLSAAGVLGATALVLTFGFGLGGQVTEALGVSGVLYLAVFLVALWIVRGMKRDMKNEGMDPAELFGA